MGLLNKLIDKLELNIQDPKVGLPDEILYGKSAYTISERRFNNIFF